MASAKPIINITAPASAENVKKQIKKVNDYTESVLKGISQATTNNEVVQARMGHDTLSQTLEHYYNHLPVVRYEDFTYFNNNNNTSENWINFGKLVMYWRGKQVVKQDVRFNRIGNHYYTYLVFSISVNDFTLRKIEDLQDDDIPIFAVSAGYFIASLIAFFDYDFNLVNPSDDKIENKNCFAWFCNRQANKEFSNTLHIHEIKDSTIDMRGLKSRFWRWGSTDHHVIHNSRLINLKEVDSQVNGAQEQFVFTGEGNIFHLLDATKIGSETWDGNAVEIPYDTADNYYRIVKRDNAVSVKRNGLEMIAFRTYTASANGISLDSGSFNDRKITLDNVSYFEKPIRFRYEYSITTKYGYSRIQETFSRSGQFSLDSASPYDLPKHSFTYDGRTSQHFFQISLEDGSKKDYQYYTGFNLKAVLAIDPYQFYHISSGTITLERISE